MTQVSFVAMLVFGVLFSIYFLIPSNDHNNQSAIADTFIISLAGR